MVCCLAGQGFQIYDCPRARNAKRIPEKLPGACVKPLWHAWACVLAGCALAAWAPRKGSNFRWHSPALDKAAHILQVDAASVAWRPRWGIPDRCHQPAGTQGGQQRRGGGWHKLSPVLALRGHDNDRAPELGCVLVTLSAARPRFGRDGKPFWGVDAPTQPWKIPDLSSRVEPVEGVAARGG